MEDEKNKTPAADASAEQASEVATQTASSAETEETQSAADAPCVASPAAKDPADNTSAAADPATANPAAADPAAAAPPAKPKKAKKPVYFPFWRRLLIFLLGLVVGLAGCVGAVVGVGFWAYKNISVQKLQEMGIVGDLPEGMQGKGEVDITTYTLADLLAEAAYYAGAGKDTLSINGLEKRYGLKMLSDVKEMLPAGIADLQLSEIAAEGGLNKVLACIDMAFLLSQMSGSAFSDVMMDTLGSRTLDILVTGEIADLFSGVELGYLMGLPYEKQGDAWVLLPTDAEALTLEELMAELNVGNLLGEALNADGDVLSVVREDLGDITLSQMMGFSENSALGEILLEEAIVLGENGKYEFSLDVPLSGMTLGDLMKYTKVGDDWYNGDVLVGGVDGAVANIFLSDVMNGNLDVMSAVESVYLGEMMNYTAVAWDQSGAPTEWKDEEGAEVLGFNKVVACLQIASVSGGDMDVEELFGETTLGELQGYVLENGTWYEEAADGSLQKLDAIHQTVAAWRATDLLNDALDIDAEVQNLTIGDVMGYTHGEGNKWYDSEGNELTRVLELLADKKVSELNDTVHNWELGNLMGYTKEGDLWVDENGGDISNLMQKVGDLRLADIADEDKVLETVQDLTMADVMHYKWVDGAWYNGETEVTGVLAYLADCKVGELDSHVAGMSVADVLELKKVDGVWLDPQGNRVSGILAAAAEFHIEDLEAELNDLVLSDIFENTDSGFFKILGGDTRVDELEERLDALFSKEGANSATIGDFIDAGLIKVTTSQSNKLKSVFGNTWRNISITMFVEKLINLIP